MLGCNSHTWGTISIKNCFLTPKKTVENEVLLNLATFLDVEVGGCWKNVYSNAIPDAVQFLIQCNSWCSTITDAMQFPKLCNSRWYAISDAMKFPIQYNSQCSAIPNAI